MRSPAALSLAFTLLAQLALGCAGSGASSTGSGTSAQSSGSGGGTTTGGGTGGATGACSPCEGACVDLANDPRTCGACGEACSAGHPLCDHGQCQPAPCAVMGPICPTDLLCCGMESCPDWKICCNVPGKDLPTCVSADAGACPTSCAGCD